MNFAHRNLFVFILAACFVCTAPQDGLSFHNVTTPVLTAFLLAYPIRLLPNRLQSFFGLLLGETVMAVCLVDCYCQIYFDSPITPQMLKIVLQTNTHETREFLSTFVSGYIIFKWRIILLLLLAILLPLSLFYKWNLPIKENKIWRIASIVCLTTCIIVEIPVTYRYAQLFLQQKNLKDVEGLIFRHYHEALPTSVHRLAFAYYASNLSADILDGIKHSTYFADIDSCSYQSSHIVLIIGESYNKHHSSLYGYHLKTAPLQQQREANGELFPYTDAVTSWNITSNVFLDVFSLWEHEQERAITDYPLFPILFRRAGYAVNFFSNQYLLKGFRKGSTNQAGHFFLADAEMSDSLFSYRNRKSKTFDMGLVSQISDYKNRQSGQAYTLDIIHLIGQHFEYAMRYPQAQAKFTLKDYADRTISDEAKEIVMHYDNATRYDDMVLDSLLSLYSQEEAIVVFIADHGEEVYDGLPMHGRSFQDPTAIQARQEFEVPMWIWCSESYRNSHPEIMSSINASLKKPFMTDGIPQILLWLAGIKCRWMDVKRNLLSPHYQCKKRVIAGTTDYDDLMRSTR